MILKRSAEQKSFFWICYRPKGVATIETAGPIWSDDLHELLGPELFKKHIADMSPGEVREFKVTLEEVK